MINTIKLIRATRAYLAAWDRYRDAYRIKEATAKESMTQEIEAAVQDGHADVLKHEIALRKILECRPFDTDECDETPDKDAYQESKADSWREDEK